MKNLLNDIKEYYNIIMTSIDAVVAEKLRLPVKILYIIVSIPISTVLLPFMMLYAMYEIRKINKVLADLKD